MVMAIRKEIRRLHPDVSINDLDVAVKNIAAAWPESAPSA
jgi:hypothetical protein